MTPKRQYSAWRGFVKLGNMRFPQRLIATALIFVTAGVADAADAGFCPEVYRKAVLQAPFNVAFLHIQKFDMPGGGKRDGLLMSSFFNAVKDPTGVKVESYRERDLVARIPDLDTIDVEAFDGSRDIEVLTDLDDASIVVAHDEDRTISDVSKLLEVALDRIEIVFIADLVTAADMERDVLAR